MCGPRVCLRSVSELECWSQTVQSLPKLAELQERTVETTGRVNRLISAWPTDDTLPAEGYESVKSTYKKLVSGLTEIKNLGNDDLKSVHLTDVYLVVLTSIIARAIDETLERIEVLIAMRKASEVVPPGRASYPLVEFSPHLCLRKTQQTTAWTIAIWDRYTRGSAQQRIAQ